MSADGQDGKTKSGPGSPTATRTIDGKYIPPPPEPFGGEINLVADQSKPYWPAKIVPPDGAPNILLIMTDDAGYGVPSTFGGVIPTPTMDRVARMGLLYTQFHSTALCSPTRAALITGRNHHSVGFGVITELSTGYPGYDSVIGPENATIGAILKNQGYATSWFGKEHNTPSFKYSVAGPFDQWPVGMGFEYFYGFMGGETDQYRPYLFQNQTQIFPWIGRSDYNLTTDLADEAISYLKQLDASAPDKPFFLYYVPGGTHAPHQPTQEWIDKFKGKFDMGWNALREQIFQNQKRLGVIPAGTTLTNWPNSLPKWDSLSADEKKIFARQAEVFAAYAAYTDYEIGRVVQAVEDLGKLDNTLIIYISGDNGCSAEGTALGSPNIMAGYQGIDVPVDVQLKFYDLWGTDKTYPHMSAAWAWAWDTPFQWTKQIASHFGGTRQGMAMAWPRRIKDVGGVRTQFHHMIDIVPTILEAVGIEAPVSVDGIGQKLIEGVSMAYTFDKANADAPSTRSTQYFEMLGNRAIYHEGWIASTTPSTPPWIGGAVAMPDVLKGYPWELYNIAEDYSQANDLAAKEPEKLRELQLLFLVEAAKYNVLPLDNSWATRKLTPRPSGNAGKNHFTYKNPISGIDPAFAPDLLNKSYSITAEVDLQASGGEGMIATMGGRFGGYGLYLLKSKPVFLYNFLDLDRFRWEGAAALAPGKHTIVFKFTYDGPGFGKSGTGVLGVDGSTVATQTIPHTIPFLMALDETFDIGCDTRTPVCEEYQIPFPFTGTINSVTYQLGPDQLTEADHAIIGPALARAKD